VQIHHSKRKQGRRKREKLERKGKVDNLETAKNHRKRKERANRTQCEKLAGTTLRIAPQKNWRDFLQGRKKLAKKKPVQKTTGEKRQRGQNRLRTKHLELKKTTMTSQKSRRGGTESRKAGNGKAGGGLFPTKERDGKKILIHQRN